MSSPTPLRLIHTVRFRGTSPVRIDAVLPCPDGSRVALVVREGVHLIELDDESWEPSAELAQIGPTTASISVWRRSVEVDEVTLRWSAANMVGWEDDERLWVLRHDRLSLLPVADSSSELESIAFRGGPTSFARRPDGRLTAIGVGADVLCLHDGPPRRLMRLSGHAKERVVLAVDSELRGRSVDVPGLVRCLAISADEQYLVSTADDCTIRLWDVGRERQVDVFSHGYCDWVAFGASPEQLLLCGPTFLGAFDLPRREFAWKRPFPFRRDGPSIVALSNDRQLAANAYGHELEIFSTLDGSPLANLSIPLRSLDWLTNPRPSFTAVAFAAEGRLVVGQSTGELLCYAIERNAP